MAGSHEVRGSIPLCSTKFSQVRCKFGLLFCSQNVVKLLADYILTTSLSESKSVFAPKTALGCTLAQVENFRLHPGAGKVAQPRCL